MKTAVILFFLTTLAQADICQDMNPVQEPSSPLLAVNERLRPACTMRDILEHNRTHLPDGEAMVPIAGGGYMRNPYHEIPRVPGAAIRSPSIIEGELLSRFDPQPESAILQVVSDVRENFLSTLMRGTPETELTPQQRLMVNRIRSINVSISRTATGAEGTYDPQTNAIVLSPNSLKRPRLALAMLMAHEFGHSLDVCSLTARKIRKKGTVAAMRAAIPANVARPERNLWERIFSSDEAEFLDTSAQKGHVNKTTLDGMIAQGLFEVVEEGLPLQDNPTYPAYQCLSGAFRGAYPPIDESGPCAHSFIGEAGAQIWASMVMTNYISRHPASSSHEGLGLFGISLPALNKPVLGKEKDVNDLYLHRPEFQAVFDCTPVTPTHQCF